MKGWTDLFRVGKRFRGISSAEISQLVSFLTGSLGEFLDHNYESEKMKTMFLANNVYGKHGGPYQPGTAIGLLFHLLSGGEHELQGFYGHVMGGMGSITQALAAAGKEARRGDSHVNVRSRTSTCATAGRAASCWKTARNFGRAWFFPTPIRSEHSWDCWMRKNFRKISCSRCAESRCRDRAQR